MATASFKEHSHGLAWMFIQMTRKDIVSGFEADFRRKFARAAAKGLVGATRQVEGFIKGLQADFGNAADAEVAFSEIAEHMRVALLASYDKNVAARKLVPSYREGANRYSGGALRRALEDPTMAIGDANGISYLNRTLLDVEAAHWRRLNFGARGKAVSGNTNFYEPVFFDQRVLFYAGSESQPSPAFLLPPGFWVNPTTHAQVDHKKRRGGYNHSVDKFFPRGFGGTPTRGIVPRHFIDAGFKVLAAEYGPALEELFRKWSYQATDDLHPSPVSVAAE